MRTRLAVGRVIVYKSRVMDKTGGPFSYHTSLEPGLSNYGGSTLRHETSPCSRRGGSPLGHGGTEAHPTAVEAIFRAVVFFIHYVQ